MYWDYSENLRKHVMKIKKIVLDGIAAVTVTVTTATAVLTTGLGLHP